MRFHIGAAHRTCIWTTYQIRTWPEILKLHIQFASAATREPCLCVFLVCTNTNLHLVSCLCSPTEYATNSIRFFVVVANFIFAFHFKLFFFVVVAVDVFALSLSIPLSYYVRFKMLRIIDQKLISIIHKSKHFCILRYYWVGIKTAAMHLS